jgi:radical SAM superfamily enzyme YgiQ (UPF0313 family)
MTTAALSRTHPSGRPWRVALLLPDAHMHIVRLGSFRRSMREAPLTLTTLAALGPEELDIDWTLADELVENVPLDGEFDLVGISLMTGTATRGYELADHFRHRGIPVVLGGIHTTLLPDEAARHADAIVTGMAELTWPQLLRDFAAGQLQRCYDQNDVDPDGLESIGLIPTPRFDLQRRCRYNIPSTVMATRGCMHACEFCTVKAIWKGFLRRPVEHIIRDIEKAPGKLLAFNDVSLLDDPDFAAEFLKRMIPMKRIWGGLSTLAVAENDEMLDLLQASGCRYLLIGFESVNQSTLSSIRKGFNRQDDYARAIERLHAHNISVQGCFVLGLDGDDESVFERTVQRVNELNIDIPRYSIFTAYPGTPVFAKVKAKGRILSERWEDYDTMHVTVQPSHMSPQALFDGFKWAYRETFRLPHILRRMRGNYWQSIANVVGNLNYRRFARRLERDPIFAQYNSTITPERPGE